MIGQIVIGQRMNQRAKAAAFDRFDHRFPRRFQEMDFILGKGMRSDTLVRHLSDEQQPTFFVGPNATPKFAAVIRQMVDDQRRTVDRIATLILDNGGIVDRGEFPMNFTAYNDVSPKFLLGKIIERQEKTIAMIEKIADALAIAPYAQAATREALGEAKGHLENLQELAAEPAGV